VAFPYDNFKLNLNLLDNIQEEDDGEIFGIIADALSTPKPKKSRRTTLSPRRVLQNKKNQEAYIERRVVRETSTYSHLKELQDRIKEMEVLLDAVLRESVLTSAGSAQLRDEAAGLREKLIEAGKKNWALQVQLKVSLKVAA